MTEISSGMRQDVFEFVRDQQTDGDADEPSPFCDPSFSSNKTAPVHRWVPWIAGFSAEFVRSVLKRYSRNEGTVLDPFAGVGTTLVEAVMAGHHAVGFEINPYVALACRTKATAYELNPPEVGEAVNAFQEFYRQALQTDYRPRTKPPSGFRTKAVFYSPKVLHKVLIVQDFIADLQDEKIRNLFRVAFASTMVTYSNYSYEPSLGRRRAAGKSDIDDYSVGRSICRKLDQMARDIIWMRGHLKGGKPSVTVFNESFFEPQGRLQPGSVDLVITSPPYLNNYHYNRNTRPHLYWLGYVQSPSDMKPLEEANFGKYWQTVRARERVDLDFTLKNSEIAACLELLRTKTPDKGVYGGNGWANYAASYFNDCYRFTKDVTYSLKRGGRAIVVVGNSILQGIMVPTDRYLGIIAESAGLEPVSIHIPRATRVGNSIIQSEVRVAKAKDKHQLYEAVLELRKP